MTVHSAVAAAPSAACRGRKGAPTLRSMFIAVMESLKLRSRWRWCKVHDAGNVAILGERLGPGQLEPRRGGGRRADGAAVAAR